MPRIVVDVWQPTVAPHADPRYCPSPVVHTRFGTERMVPRDPQYDANKALSNPLRGPGSDSLKYVLTTSKEIDS